ncbi:hypothetical protein [Anaerocolumna chitinilytica]|uniref:Uncharacterized protein n=1 Tax=Anaerocolumna chitinilytica TaxID=1727145 RepID=A0A7M3SA24_9FIRM|nr:hypothetical protein [Anaerocolumna chitinilytica]BCK01442.1 hypothetical protein bsdcttw_44820 [Anaerocolumna chitinilytica]
MAKELIVRGHFKTESGEYKSWDSFTPEEKEQIGIKMNDRMLRAIGYVPVNELKKDTA